MPGDLHTHVLDTTSAGPSEVRYVTVGFLARYWSVHPNTVYRDIRKGALRAHRLPGGQFRVRWLDARRYGRPLE